MDDELDLTESIQPRSDQINADDLIAGPITYTIREVTKGGAEQPFDFLLVETDRAYRPSKTMRRVIVAAWGPQAAIYAGGKLTLYREPSITFGGKVVGGIRISHMSNIDAPVEVSAQTTRGKREQFTVQPLPDTMSPPDPGQTAAAGPSDLPHEPVTTPTLASGELRKALTMLNQYQKDTLFIACGLNPSEQTPLKTIRAHMCAKWIELGLPDFEGEPVPVTLLGAIYAASRDKGSAEAFDILAKTGQDVDEGDQIEFDEVMPA